jgi:hypothetical protein
MRSVLMASTLFLAACQVPVADAPAEADCGAGELQHLVGMRATAVEGMTAPGPVRVYRTGQPITMDLRPDRLNLELDAQGRRILRVFCG